MEDCLKARQRRRDLSYRYARRAQDEHMRWVHQGGEVDCICERSVWYFEKQKSIGHRKHCWMCHPKYRETPTRTRLKVYVRRYSLAPTPRIIKILAR